MYFFYFKSPKLFISIKQEEKKLEMIKEKFEKKKENLETTIRELEMKIQNKEIEETALKEKYTEELNVRHKHLIFF